MPDQATTPHGSTMELSDIYYTLFRHKWKILICSLAGLGAAFAFKQFSPPPYQSDAKLFIRYVVTEKEDVGPAKEGAITRTPDMRGETIMNSEAETLTSLDLAEAAAKQIGPEKILAKMGGGASLGQAAGVIRGGLFVDVGKRSSVMDVSYIHPDPEAAPLVLRGVIDAYLKKHVEIHRSPGLVGDFLTQETDQLRAKLAQTEEELRKVRNQAGIISLEDSKKSFAEQITKLHGAILEAQAELAERTAVLQEIAKRSPGVAATPAEGTNATTPPQDKIAEYQKVVARWDLFRKREQELLNYFSEQSSRVKEIRAQLTEAEQLKQKLESEYPALAQQRIATPSASGSNRSINDQDPAVLAEKIAALQARIKILNTQLEEVRAQAAKVDGLETTILELRRRQELQETNYRYYAAALEQSRIRDALGTGQVSNISVIQSPTPAYRDWSKKTKVVGGIAAGGIALGLAWAFLIELYFDRSVRRPADIERTLGLPLFLSIPRIGQNGKSKSTTLLLPAPSVGTGSAATASSSPADTSTSLALSTANDNAALALNPFHETLRDRLISYFDSLNLRHKPKLVAVTGVGKDAGVTTIAAGLAKSFSETGEGNVLLVDMTKGQGSAQHFHKGSQVHLDQLLNPETKESAQVQDNLYVVTEDSGSERLAKGMPQRFNQLVPKLKASDFDYIIFDMPPVNQISITPRLANFMDMMLMVVESEKTNRDIAGHASALLAKSKTPVGVVLNKTKTYIPGRLHQDHEFMLGT